MFFGSEQPAEGRRGDGRQVWMFRECFVCFWFRRGQRVFAAEKTSKPAIQCCIHFWV